MAIQKGDFVELTYTGKMREEDLIFDTTDEKIAKEESIHNPQAMYGPVIVCVGERHVIQGLDDALIGKEKGDFEILVAPEDGFGKKDSKLLRLMPISSFKKQEIVPQPGLQVNIDGSMGMVKTVTGGRVIVDFNHPLSGKDLSYQFSVMRVVEKTEEKVEGLIRMMGLAQVPSEITDKSVELTFPAMLPNDMQQEIQAKIKALIPEITAVTFKMAKPEAPKPDATPAAAEGGEDSSDAQPAEGAAPAKEAAAEEKSEEAAPAEGETPAEEAPAEGAAPEELPAADAEGGEEKPAEEAAAEEKTEEAATEEAKPEGEAAEEKPAEEAPAEEKKEEAPAEEKKE